MDERNKLGLVGRVVLAGGALVGGLNSGGCLAVAGGVAGYYAGKSAEQNNKVGPMITIQRWSDSVVVNDSFDKGEILGDIGDSVNLSNVGLYIRLSGPDLPVTYTILDSNDNVIDTFSLSRKEALKINRIRKDQNFPVGKYTIVARRDYDNVCASREFEVMR